MSAGGGLTVARRPGQRPSPVPAVAVGSGLNDPYRGGTWTPGRSWVGDKSYTLARFASGRVAGSVRRMSKIVDFVTKSSDQRERSTSTERQLAFGWRPCRPVFRRRAGWRGLAGGDTMVSGSKRYMRRNSCRS